MQTTDEQTLKTLKILKANGALKARDSNGNPLQLDPTIASDLLNGEKLSVATVGISSKNSFDETVMPQPNPKKGTALPVLGDVPTAVGVKTSDMKGGTQQFGTDELISRLQDDCETFNHNLFSKFNAAKENMQKEFVELFKTTSKEKLPDSLLRSLPKWGKGATKLHHIFNKSMNRKKPESGMEKKDVPFELVIQPEVLEEIDLDIQNVIDNELQHCLGEKGVVIRDMQRILKQVGIVMERIRELEEALAKEEIESRALEERLQDERILSKELTERIDDLLIESGDKEKQMDILRGQVQRERDQARAKRAEFFREICRYKTQLLHLMSAEDHDPRVGKSPRNKPDRRDSQEPKTDNDMGYALGADQAEVQLLIEQKEKELKQEHQEQLRVIKLQHAEQIKQMQQQKKIAADDREEQNALLLKRIKKLEIEVIEEKRKVRRLLSSMEKDEEEDAAAQ